MGNNDIVECSVEKDARVPGETWWEPEQRLGRHRLCVYRKPWAEAMWLQAVPTGWSVSQEDRLDGQWMALQFGTGNTVVGSKEDAMAFAEATYHLGNSVT